MFAPPEVPTAPVPSPTSEGVGEALVSALAEAEHLSPDGCLLLRSVRDDTGALVDFECRYANDSVARLLRWRHGALLGQRLLVHYDSARARSHVAVLRQVVETGQPCVLEVSAPGARDQWLRVCFTRFQDGVLARYQDLSSVKTPEKEREARPGPTGATPGQTEALSLAAQLVAGMGHEINNPLAFVAGNLHVALEQLAGVAREAEPAVAERLREPVQALEEARQGAERIRAIVKDLRTLARAETTGLAPVDVHAALEFSLTLAMPQLRYRARIERHYGEVPAVRANESKLGQVFLNLLVNAAQALPPDEPSRQLISLSTRREGDRVIVEVRDTGLGMTPEVRARIFDPFFTTKARGEGLGLGLAMCLGMVRVMRGELTVDSTPGQGSTFRVALPISDDTRGVAPAAPVGERLDQPARKRVLIIDDEPGIGAVLRRILGRVHDVVVVGSGLAALELLEQDQDFDRVFCDLMMSGLTGMQLHARLSHSRPELLPRFVFMSGDVFTESAREFLGRVDAPRIDKPFDTALVRALVACAPPRTGG